MRMSGSVHKLSFTTPCWRAWQCGHLHASSWASCKGSHGTVRLHPPKGPAHPARGPAPPRPPAGRDLLLLGVELETLVQGAAVLLVRLLLLPHAVRVLDPLLLDAPEQAAREPTGRVAHPPRRVFPSPHSQLTARPAPAGEAEASSSRSRGSPPLLSWNSRSPSPAPRGTAPWAHSSLSHAVTQGLACCR